MHSSIVTSSLLASIFLLSQTAQSAYILADDYSGEAFFQSFDFFTDKDPTNGHVKYEALEKANATGLAGFMDGGNATKAVYMGVDSTSEAPDGRGSVRVSSAKSYQHALVVADIVHMPSVCGMFGNPQFLATVSNIDQVHGPHSGWSATTGQTMVSNHHSTQTNQSNFATGEIDIVEGVNNQPSNQMTLHTSSGPRISKAQTQAQGDQQEFTGELVTSDCDVNAPDQSKNAGCAIADTSNLTFGETFNTNGGGVYATEWTSSFIKIWFFERGKFPSDIASASPSPSQNWGPPTSVFAGDFNMDDHFKNLKIVFDTTFCGDWAGNTWNTSQCASLAPTCEEYVANNPAAFAEAYWAVNTLQVFQDDGVVSGGNETGAAPLTPGVAANAPRPNGRFIQNAASGHRRFGGQGEGAPKGNWIQPHGGQGESAPQGKWVQPPGGWEPRPRPGGAVLPSRP